MKNNLLYNKEQKIYEALIEITAKTFEWNDERES